MKQAAKLFGRAIGTYTVTAFLALILLGAVGTSPAWIQISSSVILIAGMCYLMIIDAGTRGERACTISATVERIKGEGGNVDGDMIEDCFSKKVSLYTYLLIASALLLFSVANIIAAPYFPPVIISDTAEMTQTNYFNVVARIVFMPLFSVYSRFNENPDGLNLIFLLFSLIIPLPESLGYLLGPKLRHKKLEAIELGKKRKLKKLKVNQKKREYKPPKMEV